MIPVSIANQLIDGINQLNAGLLEAAKWVEAQAYEGFEDEYSLVGDRPVAVMEPPAQAEGVPAAVQSEETAASPVSLVEVRTALSALSQAGKTSGQRGAKRQPGGIEAGPGNAPAIVRNRSPSAAISGVLAIKPRV